MGRIAKITNGMQERAFDLSREPDALYLNVKCSNSNKHSKIVKIKLSDVLYKVWMHMTPIEKKATCRIIKELIVADKKNV